MRVGALAAFAAVCFALSGVEAGNASAATLKTIYNFCPDQELCTDGNSPRTVTLDAQGNLYGTTMFGGDNDEGTVFSLTHNAARTVWTYHVLYSFCKDWPNCVGG